MPDELRAGSSHGRPPAEGDASPGTTVLMQTRIGNYELCQENGKAVTLGKGGFGRTYLARHVYLETKAVIKIIHDRYSDDEAMKRRFFEEARALARLDHPHIARFLNYGEEGGRLYYAMDYGDLGDLEKYVTEHAPLGMDHILDLAMQAAEALEHTHSRGLLHRDIKPSNFVMCSKDGATGGKACLKVIDFGLAKRLEEEGTRPSLTPGGTALISPCYASPEQMQNRALDVRSDIFSFGLTLWFMLAGRPLFNAEPARERTRMGAHLPEGLDLELDELLESMVAFAPEDRPGSMTEVLERLHFCRQNLSSQAGRLRVERHAAGLETEYSLVHKLESARTPTYEAVQNDTGEPVCLRWFAPEDVEDAAVWKKLRQAAAATVEARPPYVLRAQRLMRFEDCGVIQEERGGDLSIKALAAATKGLPLSSALPLVLQLAHATDWLHACRGLAADLRPDQVFVHFPRSSWAKLEGRDPLQTGIAAWPPFVVRLQADYVASGEAEDEDAPVRAGATVVLNMDELVSQMPVAKFAGIVYYLLAARRASPGRAARKDYIKMPALNEAGNDLLRHALAGTSDCPCCVDLVKALVPGENCSLLRLPEDLETLKGWKVVTQVARARETGSKEPVREEAVSPAVPVVVKEEVKRAEEAVSLTAFSLYGPAEGEVTAPEVAKKPLAPPPPPPEPAAVAEAADVSGGASEAGPRGRVLMVLGLGAAGLVVAVVTGVLWSFLFSWLSESAAKSAASAAKVEPRPMVVTPSASPRQPYKLIVVRQQPETPGVRVLLNDRPLGDDEHWLPAGTVLPVKLRVSAPGHEEHRRELEADGSRTITVEVPVLARRTGSISVTLPPEGVDHPTLELVWVGPLAGEEGAPAPARPLALALRSGGAGRARLEGVPTGRYQVLLTGAQPRLLDQAFPHVFVVKQGQGTLVALSRR